MPEFDAVLESAEGGPGCAIRLPFDPRQVLGRARAPVVVVVDEHEPFRTTVAVYGAVAWIGLRKDQRAAFGVQVGDRVRVRVELDDQPRVVELPAELDAVLAGAPQARQRFDALSYTHRKEYARWVGEGKKAQTRSARAAKAVTMLLDDVETPG